MTPNYGQKLNTTIPFKPGIPQEDNGIPGNYEMRLFGSTFIPEDFNEWYFICASYNPAVDEDFSLNNQEYTRTPNFWLNHLEEDGTLTNNSNLGNRCKVEIISKTDLLRARGFKV